MNKLIADFTIQLYKLNFKTPEIEIKFNVTILLESIMFIIFKPYT